MLLLIGNVICHAERVTVQSINGGASQPILVKPLKHDHGPNHYSIPHDENKVPVVEASSQINLHITHHSSDRHTKYTREESSKLKNVDNFTNVLSQAKSYTALQNTAMDTTHYPDRAVVKLTKKATSLPNPLSSYKHNHIFVYDRIPRDNDEFPAAQDLPQLNQYTANQDSDMNVNKTGENSNMVNANNNTMKAVSHINQRIVLKETGTEAKGKVEKAYSNPENVNDQTIKVHGETPTQVYMVQQDSYMHFKDTKEGNSLSEKALNYITEESQNVNPVNNLYLDNTENNSIFHYETNPFSMVKKRKHKDDIRVVREAGDDKGESLGFTNLISSYSTTMIMTSIGTTTEAPYKSTPSEEHTGQQKTTTVSRVPSSTSDPPPIPYCHQSCLKALNATHMYSNDSLILSQGSDLTLICELPLNTTFYLVNLIWLFHPANSPDGQCSPSTQEFIPSCHGFQTIKNTDDRNSSILKETITLSNVLVNHTGRYMCQVWPFQILVQQLKVTIQTPLQTLNH